jgi:hypothetical protein
VTKISSTVLELRRQTIQIRFYLIIPKSVGLWEKETSGHLRKTIHFSVQCRFKTLLSKKFFVIGVPKAASKLHEGLRVIYTLFLHDLAKS